MLLGKLTWSGSFHNGYASHMTCSRLLEFQRFTIEGFHGRNNNNYFQRFLCFSVQLLSRFLLWPQTGGDVQVGLLPDIPPASCFVPQVLTGRLHYHGRLSSFNIWLRINSLWQSEGGQVILIQGAKDELCNDVTCHRCGNWKAPTMPFCTRDIFL